MTLLVKRKVYKMEKDLLKFMEKVEIINKDFSRYKDEEKGIMFSFNTAQLFPTLDYLELDKTQFETGKFENKIDKLDYNIIQIEKPSSKYARTKKEEDRFVLENQKVNVRQVWNILNALGVHKSFTNKEEALKVYNEIYERISREF